MATNADPLRELMSLLKECNELFDKAPDDEYIQKMRYLFKELLYRLRVRNLNGKWEVSNLPLLKPC
ncbi:hypothetical protein DPV78_006290 [Talaromyces pinophilus]|nr:hypothetical protein DPV78_006290 [Talaromyces pinophilus]